MTRGSCWTHLMVISAALVDQLEEGVALAGVAGEASMPAVDLDGLIEGGPCRGDLAGGEEAGQRGPEAFAQADHVVHRHAAATVEGRRPLPVFTRTAWVVGRHAQRDTFGEQLGVTYQVAQTS